jgi:phosphate starvation-inducible membrane PsiE
MKPFKTIINIITTLFNIAAALYFNAKAYYTTESIIPFLLGFVFITFIVIVIGETEV